jgi:ubiquinol-cytochrome c reductase iron-sulfur subunit
MSDMGETPGLEGPEGARGSEAAEGPTAPRRVIGTPPPSPPLLGSGDGERARASTAGGADTELAVLEAENRLPVEAEYPQHAKNAEKFVAACFVLAFIAGCGFIAAYIGLEVHSVDAVLRSNLALGLALSVALLALGLGSLIWVRHIMPDAEMAEERHPLRSTETDRVAFDDYFKEGTAASQFVKRPLIRRTLLLATLPLAVIPIVVLRDLGPLPGTSLRHTVWSPGRRLLVYGTNQPLTPADFSTVGSAITIVPEGFTDDPDALAKATVTLIRFAPGQLNIPTRYAGDTVIGTMNWTLDNIVAYSRICTHVGCPVGLYEQTTHHLLCPCHQSTFDASTGATVVFGPAPRPLPQLPLTTDAQGYLVAKSDFTQPVGPSFWERG